MYQEFDRCIDAFGIANIGGMGVLFHVGRVHK